jgi:hypothetical protein
VTLELARHAAAFAKRKGWSQFGYGEPSDFCREMLDRSGRWLRDLSFLGESLERLPGLGAALDGSDGLPAIGRMAALQVAQVATPATVPEWIAVARRTSVRELAEQVRSAQADGAVLPVLDTHQRESVPSGVPEAADSRAAFTPAPAPVAGSEAELEPQVIVLRAADLFVRDPADTEVRIELPLAAAAAFEETLELHRMVSGRSSGPGSLVEALVGEAMAAGLSGEDQGEMPAGLTLTTVDALRFVLPGEENALRSAWQKAPPSDSAVAGIETARLSALHSADAAESLTDRWERNLAQLDPGAVQWANDLLIRTEHKTPGVVHGGARRLGWRLAGLLALEGELERCIAHLLSFYPTSAGRGRRRGSLGIVAEEVFGVSRRTLECRTSLRRALAWFPHVRAAYESGSLGMDSAWCVVTILGKGTVDAELERAWLRHAMQLTVKRLQTEVLLVERRRHGLAVFDGDDYRRPPTDAEWFASLRTVPGAARQRIEALAEQACLSQSDNVFLTLRLPEEQARDFAGIIASACREGRASRPAALPPETARNAWAGLVVILQDFAATWDDPRGCRKRAGEATHRLHGYRCLAPGCTARANLEVHHVRFRSQGGGDEEANLVLLCRWHHQEAVHGGLARCTGRAPLEILWELGKPEFVVSYCNERRVGGARAAAATATRALPSNPSLSAPAGPAASRGCRGSTHPHR